VLGSYVCERGERGGGVTEKGNGDIREVGVVDMYEVGFYDEIEG